MSANQPRLNEAPLERSTTEASAAVAPTTEPQVASAASEDEAPTANASSVDDDTRQLSSNDASAVTESDRKFASAAAPAQTALPLANDAGGGSHDPRIPCDESHHSKPGTRRILALSLTLFGCTVLLLATVAYLTFLWFSNGHGWKRIILSNWVATSVAICGIVIRWTASLQMGIATALLALHFLKTGVPLSRTARLSTLRHNNSGPLNLMYVMMDWSRAAFQFHGFLLLLLSVLVSLLLQLSSTLLVSDLAAAQLETFENSTDNPGLTTLALADLADRFYSDVLMTTPPSYPLFAEFASEGVRMDGVDDTGPTVRALLPVSADQGRADVLSFTGNATIYDARWICTRPKASKLNMVGGDGDLWLSGEVTHSVLIPPMVKGNDSAPFNCSLPMTKDGSWAWTALTCPTNSVNSAIGLVSGIDTVYNGSIIHPMLNVTQVIGDSGSSQSTPWTLPYDASQDMSLGYFFDWPIGTYPLNV
jgi:hypothetical protein